MTDNNRYFKDDDGNICTITMADGVIFTRLDDFEIMQNGYKKTISTLQEQVKKQREYMSHKDGCPQGKICDANLSANPDALLWCNCGYNKCLEDTKGE